MSGRVLCGYVPDRRGNDALALAALAARVMRADLVLAHVHPPSWPVPNQGAVDAEWRRYLDTRSDAALAHGQEVLSGWGEPAARTVVAAHRGSGRGLADVAVREAAGLVVIGSAPGGMRARIAVGSTADQLLHGSPVPVLLAPKGYAGAAPDRFGRVTLTYRRRTADRVACRVAARLAARLGIPLRIVHVLVRTTRLFGATGGLDAEAPVLRAARESAEADLADLAAHLDTAAQVTTEILQGDDVPSALASTDWHPADLLTCGSSGTGPLRRVFLADMSMKLIRASPPRS